MSILASGASEGGEAPLSEVEWLQQFGNSLKKALDYSWTSQKELAEAIGMSESTISRFVTGQQMPSVKAVINIAHELGVDVNDLIEFGEQIC